MRKRKLHTKPMIPNSNQTSLWGQKRFSVPKVMNFALHSTPDFKETPNQEWIKFGTGNNYPDYLIKLFNESAKHNAIVNAKVNYTVGAGWEFAEKQLSNPKSALIIENLNSDGENLNEVSYKACMDYELFGGFYLEIIWDKAGKKIASIKHVDFSKIRSNKDNSAFYYTSNWFGKDGKPLRHPEENEDWIEFLSFDSEKKKGRQIFCYKSYRPSMQTYAVPEYIGAVEYIETDTLISNHCYNETKNGFVGNTIINFLNGVPEDDDKQEEIEEGILEKFTGPKGQPVLLNFADGKDRAALVEHLTPPDVFKRMTDLGKSIEQEILTGHRITSGMLVGIKTEGQLGGRSEMIDSYELMKNTVIKPKQKVLNTVFNFLLSFNQVDEVVLIQSEPISVQFSEQTLLSIMTTDELREKIGLPKLEVPKPDNGAFAKQEKAVIETFKKYGKPRSEFNVIKKRFVGFKKTQEAEESERNLKRDNFAQYNSLERAVLDLLTKDELMTAEQLSKALKRTKPEIEGALKSLVTSKAISPGKETSGDEKIPSYKVTDIGQEAIVEKPASTADIYVKYSYEVIPGLGKPIIDTTRDFCRELIGLDLLYSREDIEMISAEVGYNVFEMRGGWMTKKGTDVHVPHCRHLFSQNIVTKK